MKYFFDEYGIFLGLGLCFVVAMIALIALSARDDKREDICFSQGKVVVDYHHREYCSDIRTLSAIGE
jgi:hypothetical protein